MPKSKTEKTVQYATTVDTLQEGWLFIMDHLDEVGDSPSIHITPFWIYSDDLTLLDDATRASVKFEVSVRGMTEA